MQCSGRLFNHNFIPPRPLLRPPVSAYASASPPHPVLRRDLLTSSLLLLVVAPTGLKAETVNNAPSTCPQPAPTKQAFLDISIDGEPIGRIIIGLYTDTVPTGSARFIKLVSGTAGVTYRRKEFVKIMPNYVQHGGLRSYGVDAEMAGKTGRLAADNLTDDWERQNGSCQGTKNVSRSVSIIVRDPLKPPAKLKLVARKGKLEIDEEEMGKDPNGTEFVIASKDSPELDNSSLVVGRVMEGMDVVERISQVKTVQENSTSPYFRVAKLIGDKRAVVAERGFNRPYSKVVVTNCGLIGRSSNLPHSFGNSEKSFKNWRARSAPLVTSSESSIRFRLEPS